MKSIISPILSNLQRGHVLLDNMTSEQFSNKKIGPYFSSIGGHMRHVMDVFSCIFNGLETQKVDLTARERNELAETNLGVAKDYLDSIITQLSNIEHLDPNIPVVVTDDLGLGLVAVNYTLGSGLCQAHSHAIHHFACIGYILEQMDIQIPDGRFGYNPTTPEELERG